MFLISKCRGDPDLGLCTTSGLAFGEPQRGGNFRGKTVFRRRKKRIFKVLPSFILWCPHSNLFTSNKVSSSTRCAWYVRHSQDFHARTQHMYTKYFHDAATESWPLCCFSPVLRLLPWFLVFVLLCRHTASESIAASYSFFLFLWVWIHTASAPITGFFGVVSTQLAFRVQPKRTQVVQY